MVTEPKCFGTWEGQQRNLRPVPEPFVSAIGKTGKGLTHICFGKMRCGKQFFVKRRCDNTDSSMS